MKSDRRHELQQNELATYLGQINRSIEPYSRIIAVVLGGLILAGIGYGLFSSKASNDRSEATLSLIQAVGSNDAEVLALVGDQFPKTAAGSWARLYQGNEFLAEGMRLLFINRSDAEDMLNQASAAFREAIDGSQDELLQSRAYFGIARAAESRGEVEAATEAYQECLAINESEEMTKKVQQRIDSLASPETTEFLAWFKEQDFAPADPGLPPGLPDTATISEDPDIDFSSDPDLTFPKPAGGDTPREFGEGIEMPAGDNTTPAGDGAATEGSADGEKEAAPASDSEGDDEPVGSLEAPAQSADTEPDAAESTETESTETESTETENADADAGDDEGAATESDGDAGTSDEE